MHDLSSPTSLFHFAPLNGIERKEWLQQILIDNKVYFRNRHQLNDPNELRPSIALSGTDAQIRKFVRQLILERWPSRISPANRLLEENKLIYKYRKRPQDVEEILHQILDRVGLFCLSDSPAEPLLWAHYADGHRGIAIEFDANAGLFVAAQQVIYTDQAPVINRLVDGPREFLEKSTLTKGVAWSYEREWRVIARWDDKIRKEQYMLQHNVPVGLESFIRDQHGMGHYSFPSNAIRSIILGARIAPEDEDWILSVLKQSPQKISIRRAFVDKNSVITVSDTQ